tara:strand:+ start:732 stop:1013 length:282 start_codon:yes stop_codon:yes gene_type:complete
MAETGTRVNLQTGKVETFNVSESEMSWRQSADDQKAEALAVLRQERNLKLTETDWWALVDLTMTDAQKKYRQELRDITKSYSSLDDVKWPEKP